MDCIELTSQLASASLDTQPVSVQDIIHQKEGDISYRIERYVCRGKNFHIPPLPMPVLLCQMGGRKVSDKMHTGMASVPSVTTLVPAELETFWRLQGVLDFAMVMFRNDALEQVKKISETITVPTTLNSPLCGLLTRELVEIEDDKSSSNIGFQIQALSNALLWQLYREFNNISVKTERKNTPGKINYVQSAINYIHNNLAQPLTLECIATELDLHPSHFRKIFYQIVGQTPHRYIINKRLDAARELITTTNSSFAEISIEVGLGSQSHMAASFRKYLDITPRDLRRMHSS